MPTLELTNFNIVVSVLGGWISLFGLVSYLCKEDFYLSEALISLLFGVAVSPAAANFVRPLEYAGSAENLANITLSFSRLVLGVQLVLAGVQLPNAYLKKQWRPLAILLGPIMAAMWLATALLVWALVPRLSFLHSLAVAACVTPTDPVLSNVIVSGKFADHNVPKALQHIIVAESGANDGLGYPFLFIALYIVKFTGAADGGLTGGGGSGAREAMRLWFGETWGYTILLSVVYGAVVGWVARELLHWAEERKYVDRESFLVFAISLALFIVGTCGMIGSDDVLACFIAGNTFTWDDWFRLETLDDSLQPTVDMLLNVSIFMWYGAVAPWTSFRVNDVVPLYRLVLLGVTVLLLRRLPWILAVHRFIPQIKTVRQAVFVGFFGPIGVSAVFYLYITVNFLESLDVDGETRPDVVGLGETVNVVVWFLVICSVVVHGLSIPVGKLGLYLPETLSRSISRAPSAGSVNQPPFNLGSRMPTLVTEPAMLSTRPGTANDATSTSTTIIGNHKPNHSPGLAIKAAAPPPPTSQPRTVRRIGGSVIRRKSTNELLPTHEPVLSRAPMNVTVQPGPAIDPGGGGSGCQSPAADASGREPGPEARYGDGIGDVREREAVREPQQSASPPALPSSSRTIIFADKPPVR